MESQPRRAWRAVALAGCVLGGIGLAGCRSAPDPTTQPQGRPAAVQNEMQKRMAPYTGKGQTAPVGQGNTSPIPAR